MIDQKTVFNYVRDRLLIDGVCPTHREMMAALNIRNKQHLSNQIDALVEDGYLDRAPRKRRGLSLTEKAFPDVEVIGRIAAGEPLEAIPDALRYKLYSVVFPPGAFALEVGGDSMIGIGIYPGDVVILVPAQAAKNGDIVYAQIDGSEATLKRFYARPDRIILEPCNPDYVPMEYAPERVEIRGKFHRAIAMNR